MAQRPHAIPSVRCSARSRRTRQPCNNWATVGATVCYLHGGKTPKVIAKANQRHTLAELLRADPRHPWEVVLDHMHTLDAVAREARLTLGEDGTVTPQQLDRIVEYAKAAHHLAKTAIDVGAHERIAQSLQRQVELDGQVIAQTLGATLDALLDRLTETLNLPAQRRADLRDWTFAVAQRQLLTLDGKTSTEPAPVWPLAQAPQLEEATTSATADQPTAGTDRRPVRDNPPAWRSASAAASAGDDADADADDRTDELAARRRTAFVPHEERRG